MDATTAALLGAVIGFLGNAFVTWINKHFDERKAQRELMLKTAWDYYSSRLELAKEVAKERGGGDFPPFSTFLFHTIRTVDLAPCAKTSQINRSQRRCVRLKSSTKSCAG
jgi:hypothetical protein